jgi:hypothetical protein
MNMKFYVRPEYKIDQFGLEISVLDMKDSEAE